ncbi:SDR family NAD(P)-dependent oxidoreductase [Bradyrhizobium sp. 26S5]
MTDYRKLFDLTGKTAVVLGAASGIGKSSAEALASLGARVLCADRAQEGAEATAAAIRQQGGSATTVSCDAGLMVLMSRRWQRRRSRNLVGSISR